LSSRAGSTGSRRVDGLDRVLVLDEVAKTPISSSADRVSMESGSLASLRTFRTFSTGMPSFSASSSGVGSRPISLSILRDVRMIC